MIKRGNRRRGLLSLAVIISLLSAAAPAYAYFDRGTIGVRLGQSAVSLTEGDSASVSVTLSPASSDQLPGCGMAECPQICGEKDCLDENGNCKCAGTQYTTYYAEAKVTSSNSSVASASVDRNGGSVYIDAVGPGSATITVTGSLRQYTSSSASFTVNVASAPSSGGNTGGGASDSGSSDSGASSGGSADSGAGVTAAPVTSPSAGSVTTVIVGGTEVAGTVTDDGNIVLDDGSVVSPEGETVEPAPENAASSDNNSAGTVIQSDKGTINFLEIKDGPMGSDIFTRIIGIKEYADFRKTDTSGNVQYSWEFLGTDLKSTEDVDMNITVTDKNLNELLASSKSGGALYLSFACQGTLPGKAAVTIRVNERYENGVRLYLYQYDANTRKTTLVNDNLTVTNGYITQDFTDTSNYILADRAITASTLPVSLIIALAVLGALLAALIVILIKTRARKTKEQPADQSAVEKAVKSEEQK